MANSTCLHYIRLMIETDIVVVGAGLNGLVQALALAGRHTRRPLNVIVIDRADPRRFAIQSHDSRASALTLATQSMFGVLGLWDKVKTQAQAMTDIIVTDGALGSDRPSLLSFATKPSQKPAASLVENHHLFAAALEEIELSPSIHILSGQTITKISFGPGLAEICLADGQVIKTSLVIGADGRGSFVRGAAGLKLSGWDYPQTAITLTVEHALPHQGQAEEHFTPDGVFAVLPLVGQRSSLVWTEPHAEAQRLVHLPDDLFLQELQKRFGTHRGTLKLSGARHAYPLSLMLADKMTASRVALIGDAAHVIHPLAGLGLNLGFKDAAALADSIADVVALGGDIGGAQVLERYETWRRFDTVSTAYMLDGLNRLFAYDSAPLKMIRDAGLRLVDHAPALKSLFIKEAAGQTGALPRLMRGLSA
jgi:2-octaprenyl-6-methoxyphenol hydroxylase